MTEDEWESNHPQQCAALLTAWEEREKRTDRRVASLCFTIASSAGIKIRGRRPKLDDFLPEYAKTEDDDWITREMKAAENALKNHHG